MSHNFYIIEAYTLKLFFMINGELFFIFENFPDGIEYRFSWVNKISSLLDRTAQVLFKTIVNEVEVEELKPFLPKNLLER